MNSEDHTPDASAARAGAAIVVVLYHPGDDDLANLSKLADWGIPVVAVINAIGNVGGRAALSAKVQVVANPRNLGLARALNQGIGAAMNAGSRYVLLLDQDSRPTLDMFDALLATAAQIEAEGRALACVAPLLRDRKAMAGTGDHAGDASFATSGTMLTRVGWERVGPMWEPLFIDGIDHEWCFRARARGLETVLVRDAVLEHDMGDEGINLLGRYRPIHRSPVRHYFIVRNTLWLAREQHISPRWRLGELAKLAYRVPSYVLASSDRSRTIGNIAAAIADGVGRTNRRQPV
ncbi:glycosyltransferase (plasmid) [Sphingomonas sp. NY01]|uniref:glycosyltransferase n=1 Tax=Sphingomonas sp. NY01 TaxID=2968057 RepID=UPI00315D79E3